MKKLLFLFVCLLSSMALQAQQQKGDVQLQFQGSYTSSAGFDYGLIFFGASKFFTDNIEVGIQPYIFISTQSSLSMNIFSNYSFLTPDAKMVPYAGLGLNFNDLTSDTGTTGFMIKGGLRYFFRENVNFDIGPQLTFNEGANTFSINAGLGFIFGKRD